MPVNRESSIVNRKNQPAYFSLVERLTFDV